MPKLAIRDETAADVDAITAVTIAAFQSLEISRHTEQFVVMALRAAGALSLPLVAEVAGQVIRRTSASPRIAR